MQDNQCSLAWVRTQVDACDNMRRMQRLTQQGLDGMLQDILRGAYPELSVHHTVLIHQARMDSGAHTQYDALRQSLPPTLCSSDSTASTGEPPLSPIALRQFAHLLQRAYNDLTRQYAVSENFRCKMLQHLAAHGNNTVDATQVHADCVVTTTR